MAFKKLGVYVFGRGDRTSNTDAISGPAVEVSYSVAPNFQFHVVSSVANATSAGTGRRSGYGDTEIGIKYRFFGGETDSTPLDFRGEARDVVLGSLLDRRSQER